jgi:hypothetical protein
MATTSNTYTGNGSNKLFSITFPYLDTSDIDVYLNGTLQTITTQYTFANATTVEFVAAPANGAVILLDRSTDDSDNPATFFPGSSIKAADLNENFDQTLYVVQEINNNAVKLADPLYANKTYIDAADATKVNKSGDTMRPGGAALQIGDIYFNTNQNILKAWTGTVWVISAAGGSIVRWRKTASAGNTTLSGVDDLGITLAYVVGNEQVYLNGALQTRGVDYTAGTGTSITLTPALLAGDVVELHAVQGYVSATITPGSINDALVAPAAGIQYSKLALSNSIVNADVNASAGIVATKLAFTQTGTGAVARTVDSKLKDAVSVKDFGAVGDGVTDDTAAIQAAIDAVNAKGGGILFVPVGAYKLTSTITLKPKVSIIGEVKGEWPSDGVYFRKAFVTGSVFYSPSSQTLFGISFENFWIQGNKGGIGGSNGNGIWIELAHDVIFRHVWVHECPSNGFVIGTGSTSYHNYFYNCYASFNGAVGYLIQSDWARIVDCWADGNYIGIQFPPTNAGSNSFICRCHFEEWQQAAISIEGNSGIGGGGNHYIAECKFYSRPYSAGDAAHGILLNGGSGAGGCSSNKIIDNLFVYQTNYGPTKVGKYAIYLFGGACQGNIISGNSIGNFERGININSGSVRTTVAKNTIESCTLAINNDAAYSDIKGNIFLTNTTDLSDTGTLAWITDNNFAVAPTLHYSDFCSNNNSGSLGSFTPTFAFSGGSTGVTYTQRLARFEKTGKTVHYWFDIVLSSKGSSTGVMTLTTPISPRSGINTPGTAWFYQGTTITTTSFCYMNASNSLLYFLVNPTAFVSDTLLTDTAGFSGYISYESA